MLTGLRIPLVFAALFVAAPQSSAAAATLDPYGIWFREESGTKFDFYNCQNKLCAKVIDVKTPEEKGAIGIVILRNAAKTGESEWSGDLFNSQDGKTYKGTITINTPTQLTLKGCLIAFLCKSETWDKSPDQTAASTPGGKPVAPAWKPTAAGPAAAH